MSRSSEISETEQIQAVCCLVLDCISREHLSIVQISFVNPIHRWKCNLECCSTFLNLWCNNHSKFL